tara:strand:+ start:363 stop:908 length:546 start_codon:yes stop_codon:yes gene_type:complete
MDPVTLAASYSAAKLAISACKSAIETADDLSQIGGHLDAIFNSNSEVKKNKKAVEERSHNEKVVESRLGKQDGSVDDETTLAGATRAQVQHEEHEEALNSLRKALNARFGEDTWDNIIERQKIAIAAKKKREAAAREAELERQERNKRILTEIGKGVGVLFCAALIGYWLWYAATQSGAIK